MRLLTKTTVLFLILSMLVFGIGGIVTLRMIKDAVRRETDFALSSNVRMLMHAIEQGQPIEAFRNEKVSISTVSPPIEEKPPAIFKDTLAYHAPYEHLEPFRKVTVTRKINDNYYKISVMDVFIESEDMLIGVIKIMSYLFLFLSVSLILFGFFFSRRLFKPFKKTLEKIKKFDLKNDKKLQLPATSTHEFTELNRFISEMTVKAKADYIALKEFSENASHEMQTPISVALGKLELLQESKGLQSEHLELIQDAQQSLSKLSKLGQALSLLTKIENQEFSNKTITDISYVVESGIQSFLGISEMMGLTLNSDIEKGVKLQIDATLADILLTNLLKNANQHNIPDGWIKVNLNQQQLVVRNSGSPPKTPTDQLFDRFKKGNQSGGSLGLGLAIVQKICDVNGFNVAYDFLDGVHEVRVVFGG